MLTYRNLSLWTALCTLGMSASFANASEVQELTAEELSGIQDLDSRFVDAYDRLDVDGFMDCLWKSPNFVVLLYDGTVFIGWDTVIEVVADTFAGLESAHVVIDEVTFLRSVDAIMAVGTASYES